MNFKIDTKEKFTEICVAEPVISANMTAELSQMLSEWMEKPEKNLILSLKGVQEVAASAALTFLDWQTAFYDRKQSFVLCELEPAVEEKWEEDGLLEQLNVTPTLSEAWDIVQMEEIERELFSDDPEDPEA